MRRFFAVWIVLIGALVATQPIVAKADVVGTGGVFVGVSYARVLNTKTGVGGTATAFANQEVRNVQVGGVANIPSSGVSAVLVDLAATSATAGESYATIWPTGQAMPSVAQLRYGSDTVPRSNTIAVPLGTGGKISIKNSGGITDFNLDVQGYFTSAGSSGTAPGGFVSVPSTRLVDTGNGTGTTAGKLAGSGGSRTLQLTGDLIPNGASAVFANVEAYAVTADGQLNIGASNTDVAGALPLVNYSAGGPERVGVTIPLAADGSIKIVNQGAASVDVRVDVQGYFAGGAFEGGGFSVSPQTQLADTGSSPLNPGETRDYTIGGQAGIPVYGASGVMLSVFARDFAGNGGVEVFRKGGSPSGLNSVVFGAADAGTPVIATTVVTPGNGGAVSIRNNSSAPITVRLNAQGWFAAPRAVTSTNATVFESAASAAGFSSDQISQGVFAGEVNREITERLTERASEGVATSGELAYLSAAAIAFEPPCAQACIYGAIAVPSEVAPDLTEGDSLSPAVNSDDFLLQAVTQNVAAGDSATAEDFIASAASAFSAEVTEEATAIVDAGEAQAQASLDSGVSDESVPFSSRVTSAQTTTSAKPYGGTDFIDVNIYYAKLATDGSTKLVSTVNAEFRFWLISLDGDKQLSANFNVVQGRRVRFTNVECRIKHNQKMFPDSTVYTWPNCPKAQTSTAVKYADVDIYYSSYYGTKGEKYYNQYYVEGNPAGPCPALEVGYRRPDWKNPDDGGDPYWVD